MNDDRLISEYQLYDDLAHCLDGFDFELKDVYDVIRGVGSVDAVPVVRCKDCIYCVKEPNGELYCDILAVGYEPLGSKKVTDDWFCADGELEEGEQDG